MVIHLKIGPARFIDAATDPMGREWVGWTPEQTPQEIYERNRGVWHLSARADRERYTAFSSAVTGKIAVVVANEEIEAADGRRRKTREPSPSQVTRFTTR